MFYRRSLAQKYLGTDDPDEVQKMISDPKKFIETAKLLKEKSDGKCVIVSSMFDMQRPFECLRKAPWVVNGRLNIDPVMMDYMDLCKEFLQEGYTTSIDQWTEGWFAGTKDALYDDAGKLLEVFCYPLPTWGLYAVIKTGAPDSSGEFCPLLGTLPPETLLAPLQRQNSIGALCFARLRGYCCCAGRLGNVRRSGSVSLGRHVAWLWGFLMF